MEDKDIVCLDVETTGLDRDELEILQLSMVRGDGQVLMNEYFKPERHEEWPKAMAIHGITPEDVKDKKPFSSYREQINDLLQNKKLVTGYNCEYFDIPVLKKNGIQFPAEARTFDVMKKFAPVYGDWNQKHQDWNWQKLTTCAAYYGYKFKAHDALEDVKATLHCYHRLSDYLQLEASLDALRIQNTDMQAVTGVLQNQGIRQEVIQRMIESKMLFQGTGQDGKPVAVWIETDRNGRLETAKTMDLESAEHPSVVLEGSREDHYLMIDFRKTDREEEDDRELLVFDSELEAMAYMSILEQQGICCMDFAYQICEDGDEDVQVVTATEMQNYSRVSVMIAGNGVVQSASTVATHSPGRSGTIYVKNAQTWAEINRKMQEEDKKKRKEEKAKKGNSRKH
ncbi:3'-5' exonuclease [Faecalibaculum rodentium]|uniref:3'-5' exonuclease n=1 Tax=Faecalibaculum rodentium TaxID=1702221 RepID=UPI0025B26DF7|nr:3'-5' exonuclease [Faecalibaculum rodentium]